MRSHRWGQLFLFPSPPSHHVRVTFLLLLFGGLSTLGLLQWMGQHTGSALLLLTDFPQGGSSSPTVINDFYGNNNRGYVKDEEEEAIRDSMRLCTREEIQGGHWSISSSPLLSAITTSSLLEEAATVEAPPPQTIPISKCVKRDGEQLSASWLIDDQDDKGRCQFVEWNADLFCQVLNGRRLVMVGDSNMMQQFHSLVHLLEGTPVGDDNAKQVAHICAATTLNTTMYYFFQNDHSMDLSRQAVNLNPDIMIIHRGGIRYHSNEQLLAALDKLRRSLLQFWQQSGKEEDENAPIMNNNNNEHKATNDKLVFWQNMLPQHWHGDDSRVTTENNSRSRWNQWDDILQRQDAFVEKYWQQQQGHYEDATGQGRAEMTVRILDAFVPSVVRPIQRVHSWEDDCLSDVWNHRLLLQELIRATRVEQASGNQ